MKTAIVAIVTALLGAIGTVALADQLARRAQALENERDEYKVRYLECFTRCGR